MLAPEYGKTHVGIYYYIDGICGCIMAKSQVSIRVPGNTEREIERYRDEEGLEHRSEAVKQLINAGVRAQKTPGPGEALVQTAVSISGAGSVIAAIGAAFGAVWASSALMPFLASTFIFSLAMASIRVVAGRDLL
jgi:hypothetical protein